MPFPAKQILYLVLLVYVTTLADTSSYPRWFLSQQFKVDDHMWLLSGDDHYVSRDYYLVSSMKTPGRPGSQSPWTTKVSPMY